MNREDIEQWTREAGGFDATPKFLKHFAELVAQAEREACIVDIQMCIPRSGHDTPEMLFAKKVMERIRARGQA